MQLGLNRCYRAKWVGIGPINMNWAQLASGLFGSFGAKYYRAQLSHLRG